MSEKRIITDTERIDFMESRAQYYEDIYGDGRDSAWCATTYGPPLRCEKSESFRYATIRDSIDAAILGEHHIQVPEVGVIEGPSATSVFEPVETHKPEGDPIW
jgi:hypothetical protein